MKKTMLMLMFAVFALASVPALASVTLDYYNRDSVNYKFDAKMQGSTYTVEFGSSRTSTVTIQGGGDTADIITPSGIVKVKKGDKIEIKDGKIKVK
ncbi:MAG: hypothetical protein KA015_04410 [Spirochaetes bacterium]|nr:hypothetical protein [Spirochaetota bacterium]